MAPGRHSNLIDLVVLCYVPVCHVMSSGPRMWGAAEPNPGAGVEQDVRTSDERANHKT